LLNSVIAKVFGTSNERAVKRLLPTVTQINSLEASVQVLSDEELRNKTAEFRDRIRKAVEAAGGTYGGRNGGGKAGTGSAGDESSKEDQDAVYAAEKEALDAVLPEAFAVVREAGRRVVGMRHFDVQLIGGMVLHSGKISEMKTGEGKTLVATLPCYLNALAGRAFTLSL